MFLSSAKRIPARSPGATIFFLILLHFLAIWTAHAQSEAPQTIGGSRQTASDGQAAEALRGLAEKNALTVRALVGYGRIPAADMAPLAGLRGKGIDVLGATPEQLDAILQEHGATLSPEERDSLGRVAEAMREAGAGEAAADSAPQEKATDVTENAPIDDEALDAELAAILAEEVTEIPAQEDESEPSQDNAVARTDGVTFTASNVEPAALPPMKSAPFLDINALTPTQWDGAVAAAMEGMRMVYGPMSEAEEESFRKTWGVLRQYPSPDAVDYLNRFNPLLGEFLSLRGAVAEAGARLEETVEQIAWAAEADDPALAMDAMTLARQHRNTILSCQKRLDEVVAELVALGNPPDGAALMAEGQQQYKRAKDFLRGLMVQSGPEGEWVGYVTHPNNYVGTDVGDIKHQPYYFLIYSHGDQKTYSGIALDTDTYNEKEYNYVEGFDLDRINLLSGLEGDTINFEFTDEDGDPWIIHAQRYTGGPFPEFSEVSPELFEEARITNDRIYAERLEAARLANDGTLTASIGHALNDSPIKESLAHYRMRDAFHAAAVKWAAMGKELPESEEARLRQFDALVAGGAPQQVAEAQAAKQKPQGEKEGAKEAQEPKVEIGKGDTPLHIVDDQPAEDRRVIDQEAIDFHSANVAIIQLNMDKDLAEATKETDPVRRHDLEMRVLNAKANLQSEQDRIESLKTGVIVHTRSEWDDFARSQFIQNIAADQRKMEKVDRAMKKALAMADTLPYDKAAQVREIVAKGFSPEVMTATDTAKASEVINNVYTVATGHWEGEKKKADADAEWADTCLQTAEITKSVADKSLMALSFIGGPAVNRVYQGTLGYIEGGPKEAFLRVGGSYNQLTGIAVDGYRGFEAAVESGGGWEEGLKGAGWEVVKGIATDKAMGFVAGGVSRGYGALKGLKGADAPSTSKASKGKTGEADVQISGGATKPKPSTVPDDGFNRPLTEAELKGYKAGVVEGRQRVNSYKSTFKKLQTARKEKAPPSEIKKILRELDKRSAMIHSSPQAKMIMKSNQRNPKNKEMVKRFVNSMDRVHNRVQKRFHEKMDAEWEREGLAPIRNAGSGKSVNTDYDIARQVKFDENGVPIPPKKNGRPVPESLWQAEAQNKWEDSYREITGQSPKRSWETVTTSGHSEAYKDLALIEKNGVLRANKAWAGQTSDVNQFKGDHLRRKDQPFTRIEKHVEITRSTAKEYQRRLKPLMEAQVPPKTDKANYEAFMKHKEYWEKMNEVMEGMGSGRIDPLEGDRRIRLLSGGKSSLEVTHDLRNFLESLIKFGKS
ncbi:hypothetical protein [Desulfomicrobium baculatum]|uniref:Uncharacterized protein n=1 Tax=Desulfomicrobium baculatum (strain DSM 4028 / VKM B-1378 / X) TaxID=525897 RepID=C7LVJ5_DESBD|nr:hypothetical protein [Desulfomicrobium baculatum]ACU89751.1 hypothetical protein Dbac_1659 [Desulfomicrobium baculatum DSM 4028]